MYSRTYQLISCPKFVKSHLKTAREVNSNKCRLLLSTRTTQSVDFEAASEGDEDNAVQEFEYPDVIRCSPTVFIEIMGSCDGLICLQVDYEKLALWNPSTRDYKILPKPSPYHNNDFFSGLGYDSSIDDYKFVIPSCTTANGSEQIMVEVLTLKTNVWRKVLEICQGTTLVGTYRGLFCNGAVHWLGKQENGSKKENVIVSFDVAEERFKEVLGMSGNFLCALGECHGSYFEAWIHEQEYDSSASFRRLFRLPADRISQEPKAVLCPTKKG
ncbi:hypothetical protein OIU84_025068 [Salix udensis]|uniref:F-box associated beta-propeller type 1 domain-containing protein n=1 Tax=Salix udensis TaxID=889485 RepID=A0AAD6PD79_9ROSI|nr:hypothetical protein OIU84_025068 [Salix udensis]